MTRGVICAVAAIGLGLFTEWYFWPFAADESLTYFLKNVGDLKPVTMLMIGVGAVFAFWLGRDAGYGGSASRTASPILPETSET